MQLIQFDRTQAIPVVDSRIFGPNKHRKVGLVFDTGSAITEVDTEFIERIGYSARGAVHVSGVFQNLPVLVYDFDNFETPH